MDRQRTRLSRKLVNQTKRKLLLYLIGTVAILFLIIKFGIPLLINFSLFMSGGKSGQDSTQQNSPSFVAPPSLNPYASATNSAQIKLNGSAQKNQTVKLFVNNQLVDSTSTKDDGSYSFDSVTLKNGDNTIQTKANVKDKESDYSNAITVTYNNKAPTLSVDSPSDGQSFSKDPSSITVTGKTDPDVIVTVNDFRAIVKDNGSYAYTLQLQNGDNQIKVIATDQAGNKTEKDLKVTYSQ